MNFLLQKKSPYISADFTDRFFNKSMQLYNNLIGHVKHKVKMEKCFGILSLVLYRKRKDLKIHCSDRGKLVIKLDKC